MGGGGLQPNTSLEMWLQFKAFQVESGLRCQRHGKYRCPPKNATWFQPSANSLLVKKLLKITRDTTRAKCGMGMGTWLAVEALAPQVRGPGSGSPETT